MNVERLFIDKTSIKRDRLFWPLLQAEMRMFKTIPFFTKNYYFSTVHQFIHWGFASCIEKVKNCFLTNYVSMTYDSQYTS